MTQKKFCLFERPFKIQKNGIFLFEVSFFCFRDIDVFLLCKLDQWRCGKNWINDISGKIKAVFLKMSITKETKWHLYCCCHDNSFATDAVLVKTEIPSFRLNQEWSSPHNLLSYDNMGTTGTSVPSRTLCHTLEVVNGDIWFLDR